ncbi:MAG: sigma-70 family RNA polymerase sigma factor [Phycisphaeraceae bacterium]|nr:sigma-70 family RNA polymerase sigma factor [Phycisphaeraceae bacterium]
MNPDNRSQLTTHWMQAQSALQAYILSSVGNFADSEDILQQVALDVSASFERYDPGRPFIPWAMQIAKRRIADFYRKNKNAACLFEETDLELLAQAHARLSKNEGTSGEVADLLESCLDRLPEKSRRLVDLRYRDGLKPAEIAHTTGRSGGAIRVALNKIRNALGRCIRSGTERGHARGA